MADEPATTSVEENPSTPATSDTENGAPAPESTEDSQAPVSTDNYEQRYNDMRSEFDRIKTLHAAAEGQHGPEAQVDALRRLGVEAQVEEEQQEQNDDEWVDPDDRIDALERKLAERDEAEKEAHFQKSEERFIESKLSEIEGAENVKLSESEEKFIVNAACANRLENGEPNLKGAFDDLKGIKSAARDEYVSSKKAPAAPVGTAGEDKLDLSDRETRQKYMTEVFEAEGGFEDN